MENSQIAPVINLPELNEQQKEELCQQIEHLRSEHLTLTEKLYGEQDIIDPFFMDHLERFIKIYNVIIKICGRRDDLPIPELELRPSVEWIRRILYPDKALLHKASDVRGPPFPRRIHPTVSVTGMPSAV